jgi:hypothetical protein
MYPAAALVASLYSYEDLPDAIDVGGIEYAKLDPPESVGGFTRYYINANDEYLGILEGEGEDSLWTYEGGGGPCLINAFNGEGGEREDQFADTYSYQWFDETDLSLVYRTVTRVSLCRWEGPTYTMKGSGDVVTPFLEYGYPDSRFNFEWHIGFDGPNAYNGEKDGSNNSPIGGYLLNSGQIS